MMVWVLSANAVASLVMALSTLWKGFAYISEFINIAVNISHMGILVYGTVIRFSPSGKTCGGENPQIWIEELASKAVSAAANSFREAMGNKPMSEHIIGPYVWSDTAKFLHDIIPVQWIIMVLLCCNCFFSMCMLGC
jgi:hypothetical protein